jgi:hypothetical protein
MAYYLSPFIFLIITPDELILYLPGIFSTLNPSPKILLIYSSNSF